MMAAKDSLSCWLCQADLSIGHMKKKRTKLHGKIISKSVLESLALEYLDFDLKSEASYAKASTYICHRCLAKIESFETKKKEVVKIRDEILGLIEATMNVDYANDDLDVGSNSTGVEYEMRDLDEHMVEPPRVTPGLTPSRKRQPSKINVNIKHKSGVRSVDVNSPWTQENVKRVIRKSYDALSISIVQSSRVSDKVVEEIGKKCKEEVKHICSLKHNSVLKDTGEAVNHFSWDTIWREFSRNTPYLMKLIQCLLNKKHKNNKALICFLLSLIVNSHSQKMALLQRAISVLFYGKGVGKKVYTCLQPLMVCLSHSATIRLIDKVTKEHDVQVLQWSDNVSKHIEIVDTTSRLDIDLSFMDDADNEDNEDDEVFENDSSLPSPRGTSPQPPHFSPISTDADSDSSDSEEDNQLMDEEEKQGGDEHNKDEELQKIVNITDETSNTDDAMVAEDTSIRWTGFKIVGDNVDKTFKAAFQRINRSKQSLHYFHSYAMLDRIDFSGLSESCKSETIDMSNLLPNANDLKIMRSNFETLISRVLVENVVKYSNNKKEVDWHIHHKHMKEMSQKSITIPLGVFPLNENKLDEMCQILDRLQVYCPKKRMGNKDKDGEVMIDTLIKQGVLASIDRQDVASRLLEKALNAVFQL